MKKKLVIICIIILGLIVMILSFRPQTFILKKFYKIQYKEYVNKYAKENEIDPFMIFAIIKNESKFKQNIVSNMGAIGLMQLMESTAQEIAKKNYEEVVTKEDLYSPEINIKLGTKYFKTLIKHYNGNEGLAIAAYNAGIGNVDSWIKEGIIKEDGSNLENIPYKETNNHVRKILRDYKIYKKLYK